MYKFYTDTSLSAQENERKITFCFCDPTSATWREDGQTFASVMSKMRSRMLTLFRRFKITNTRQTF